MEWAQFWSVGVLALLIGLVFGAITFSTETEVEVEKIVEAECPECEVCEVLNVSLDQEILDKLNEDDAWEDETIALATEEWEDNDYKDIFKFLEDNSSDIDDKDDIIYVREDKKTTFGGMDADDKDAIVTQYVTVKYEDSDGDNIKRDLIIITEIEDGDVEDQKIDLSE